MAGIAGFISALSVERASRTLKSMGAALCTDDAINSGSLVMERPGIAVTWADRRGSFSDCNPIWNRSKDLVLVFSGEHFPEPDGWTESTGMGWHAAGLMACYERYGSRFFEQLNGVFSGVLIDRRSGQITVFNDRYGLGRIYYHENETGFFFGTTARALLSVLPETRQLDPAGLGEFFSCGCALQNRTLFAGISILPVGSAWQFSRQAVRKTSYFQSESWEAQEQLPEREYYEALKNAFNKLVPRYLQGSKRIGLSLTGGLDSRMILASLAGSRTEVPCYTFGGMYRECADVRLAKQLAIASGHPHRVIPVDRTFFAEFPVLAREAVLRTDGAMDVSGAVELFVNRQARDLAPVRVTGNYGSEILRCNVAFKPASGSREIFEPGFSERVEAAGRTYEVERNGPVRRFIAFKQVPWFHYARFALEQSQLTTRSPFLDNELVAIAFRAPAQESVNQAVAHRFIAESNPALAAVPTDRGIRIGSGNAGPVARFAQEFVPRLEYLFDYGMPHWLSRLDNAILPRQVSRVFLGRQKFYHFRTWYRRELSEFIQAVLLDRRSLERPYLNSHAVEEAVRDHVQGRRNFTLELHKLLSCELLQRELLDDWPGRSGAEQVELEDSASAEV